MQTSPYVGRFAPSPTGPLHFGSLLTAFASYCDAKAQGGEWLVRIEDTDIPRIAKGSTAHILASLTAFGFEPDREIAYQSQRLDLYRQILAELQQKHAIYACQCPRKILGSNHIYQGTCRDLGLDFAGNAIRLKIGTAPIHFDDRVQGHQISCLADDVGDFVLQRRDGIFSYQLAVVVDDAMQGVTDVVRGADLLDNTARQIWLGQVLGYPPLRYLHLPLAMNEKGQKLSKQNLAQALDLKNVSQDLAKVALALGQRPLDLDNPKQMLQQAVEQWQVEGIPNQTELAGIFV